MSARILLVDDSEPWRQLVRSILQATPGCDIVGEVADGGLAVEQARALKPDLILMDVGLPTINGIDAARRILERDPAQRILFVSEQRSWDVTEAALLTGAHGYVFKLDAGRELRRAVEAVLRGGRFVSSALAGRVHLPPGEAHERHEKHRHAVGFYEDESSLVDGYARFVADALVDGGSVAVLDLRPRLDALRERLRDRDIDVHRVIKEGRYLACTVADGISGFMVDGLPDPARFWSAATSLVLASARASQGRQPRLSACGACAPWLLREGRVDAALQLERLWDAVTRVYDVELFCAYCVPEMPGRDHEMFHTICAEHTAVLQL